MNSEYYYCTTCQKYFKKSIFKNRQTWSAHCSNCVRGRQNHTIDCLGVNTKIWDSLLQVIDQEYNKISEST